MSATTTDYETAVTEQLRDRGSVVLTSAALAWLLGAAARPADPVPHPDLEMLWRALLAANPTHAQERWAECWNTTPQRDRLHLLVLAASIPDLDPHH